MFYGVDAWGNAIPPMLRRFEGVDVTEMLITKAQLLEAYYIPVRYLKG